jgi:hypothetical protein
MGINAYVPLANITITGTPSSVTFSSISGVYRDLVLIASGFTAAQSEVRMQFNDDTGANYSNLNMYGSGSGTASTSSSGAGFINHSVINWYVDDPASVIYQIMDYATTDKHKSMLTRQNRYGQGTAMHISRWASTSAITKIKLYAQSSTFVAGTTFTLYGVAA